MSKNASLPQIRESAGPASGIGNGFRDSGYNFGKRSSTQLGDYDNDDRNFNPYENDSASGHGGNNLFQATQNFGGRES
jgi:hypothetical protein